MARTIDDPSERLRQLGHKTRGEVDFSRFLAQYGSLRDELLAELIEQDGRMRLVRGKSVTLERYIKAIPDLLERPDPLDAAIDVTLRSLSRSSHPDEKAIDQLIERYPQLADSIEEAAALNNALWSTTGLRRKLSEQTARTLPEEFGPPISGSEHGESRYLLQKLLGSGAYGQVYLAIDRQLSDEGHPALVAIKILSGDDHGRHSRHALAEEANKARRIDHPNAVRVLDRGISACDEDYIVYEYVDGGDLGRWLRNRQEPIPVRQAVRLAAQIARGVQAAHAAGLVHCDLKPGNIMLKGARKHVAEPAAGKKAAGPALNADDRDADLAFEPKVADFGIAIRSGESLPSLQQDTDRSHPIGNLAYISPEQYRMEDGSLTVPSDVYALGGILFTLLTGELPNGSTIDEIAETHHPDIGRTEPPRLRHLRPEVDADLEAICRRAMAIKPEDRYSAAGALADDLEAWLRYEPLYWTRPSFGRMVHLWIRRRPTMAASLLGGVLMLTVGAAVAGHYAIAARDAAALALDLERQREIEQIRADHEARITAERASFAERMQNMMYQRAQQSQATTEILSSAWVLQHFFAAVAPEAPEDVRSFQDVRRHAIEDRISRLHADGLGNSLEALLWQTNLVFWMIGRGDVEQAEPILPEVRQAWTDILESGDPWFDLLDALDASLIVRRHLAARTRQDQTTIQPEVRDAEIASLTEAEDVLLRYERALAESDSGNPAHHLVLEVLRDLYSPVLLDDPAKLQLVTEQHRVLSIGDRARRTSPSRR